MEKKRFNKRVEIDALVCSVYHVWESEDLTCVISKVYDRLKKVLILIVEGNGGNDFVETKRGKKWKNLDTKPVIDLINDDNLPVVNENEINYFDIIDEDMSNDEKC